VFAHGPGSICCALKREVVNRDEVSVARQVKVGFDEAGAKLNGALKCRESVFRRVTRRAAMRDYPGSSHCVRYPTR
jgi:hypothetical protein